MPILSKKPTKVPKGTVSGLVISLLIAGCVYHIATSEHAPSVDVGKSYVTTDHVSACKTKEAFDKVMTLSRAGDHKSVDLYLLSGQCDVFPKGTKFAVTDRTVFMVEITKEAQAWWTNEEVFAKSVE